MPNRYNQIFDNPWVSTYVPLPFEEIIATGDKKQKALDLSKKALQEDTDPLAKIGNLNVAVKGYDRQGNVVDLQYDDLERTKNQTMQSLSAEREQLASDLATGKISDVDFKRKAAEHTRKATNAYTQLSSYKGIVDRVKENNETLAKNKEFGLDNSYGTNLLEYNTDFYNKAKAGKFNDYVAPSVADKFDMQKSVLDFKFKDEGGESVSLGDYITKTGSKGVTADRVKYAADAIFNDPNSDIRRYAEMRLNHDIRLNPNKYKDDKAVQSAFEKLKNNFIGAAIAEHAGIVSTADAKADPFELQRRRFKREDELASPLTQTGAGDEVKGIETLKSNPQYAKYVNDDGSIDWTGLFDESKGNPKGFLENVAIGMHNTIGNLGTLLGFGWGADAPGYKEANDIRNGVTKDANNFEKSMRGEITSIAKSIGYTGKLTTDNYDDILRQAEQFSKTRGLSLEYHDAEQKVYTDRLNSQKMSYTFIDPSTGTPIGAKDDKFGGIMNKDTKLTVLSRLSRPVDGKGAESVLKVSDQEGNVFYAREKDNEATTFFDNVYKVNNSGINYVRTGKIQNNTSIDSEKIKTATFNALNSAGSNIGYNVASIDQYPSNPNELVVTIANPTERGQQQMIKLVNVDGEWKPQMFKIAGEDKIALAPNEFMSLQNQKFAQSHLSGALRKANQTYKTETVEDNEEADN